MGEDCATAWGRITEDGTVFVRTASGERVVGSWQAGDARAGLAFYERKFAGLLTEVDLLEQRLAAPSADAAAIRGALDTVAAGLPTAAAVGDLDSLHARVATLQEQATARVAAVAEQRREARAAALTAKQSLAEEAERLAESSDWKAAGDRLRDIVEHWRDTSVERRADAALLARVRGAQEIFSRRRGAHFAGLAEARKLAAATKDRLVTEAEALATSVEFGPGHRRYRELMEEWKATGRASKETEDALWARFRAAQDTFYARRAEATAERDAGRRAGEQTLLSIVTAAESLDLADPRAAQTALRDLQERYDRAGKAPPALDARMRAAEDRVRRAVDDRWAQANPTSSPMVIRLRESIDKLEARLLRARAAGDEQTATETEAALTTQREWLARADG